MGGAVPYNLVFVSSYDILFFGLAHTDIMLKDIFIELRNYKIAKAMSWRPRFISNLL